MKLTKKFLNVRKDTIDFRDLLFIPTLKEIPDSISLTDYQKTKTPVLDQGNEGACCGFGLAAMVNYLLNSKDRFSSAKKAAKNDNFYASPYMLYEMAKKYDEWPGEKYEGSSPRGAMKAWHKHGVCGVSKWNKGKKKILTRDICEDSRRRPLGAYFRVNHKDLVAMHCAIAETGILYASAVVHEGWDDVDPGGKIKFNSESKELGGHAFAIVAYDADGFWIQNSWGKGWGKSGFGFIGYDDWLKNGMDVWVGRLAVPVNIRSEETTAKIFSLATKVQDGDTFDKFRPHLIMLGNDGELCSTGTYANDESDVKNILFGSFKETTKNWSKKRLLIYAHGGLTDEYTALQRVADYKNILLKNEIYPLFIIWKTGFWETLSNILSEAFKKRRTEGAIDKIFDFMQDRIDDSLELLASGLGKMFWDEMKENALYATMKEEGGARLLANLISGLPKQNLEIHVTGHSAGSIILGPFIEYLSSKSKVKSVNMAGNPGGLGLPIKTCTLWAPACTMDLFQKTYMPAFKKKEIENFLIALLEDKAEQNDNCAKIYNKSLLYLVSNSFESQRGTSILGMDKFLAGDRGLVDFLRQNRSLAYSPSDIPEGYPDGAGSETHGGFDDDPKCIKGMIARILGKEQFYEDVIFNRSKASKNDKLKRYREIIQS